MNYLKVTVLFFVFVIIFSVIDALTNLDYGNMMAGAALIIALEAHFDRTEETK